MKNKTLILWSKRIKIVALLLITLTLFIPFLNGITMSVTTGSSSVVTTYRLAFIFMFGGELVSEHISYKTISVSVLPLIGYLIIIIAFLLLTTSIFIKNKKHSIASITTIASFLLLIIGSVMLLFAHKSIATVLSSAILGSHSSSVANTIYKNTSLGFGFWGTSLFGVLGAILIFTSLLFDGTIDKIRSILK